MKQLWERLLEEEYSAEGPRGKALRFSEVHLVCFIDSKGANMARAEGPMESEGLVREVRLNDWVGEYIMKRLLGYFKNFGFYFE